MGIGGGFVKVIIAGFGSGEGGFGPRIANMFSYSSLIFGLMVYGIGQGIWAMVDLWRFDRQESKKEELDIPPS